MTGGSPLSVAYLDPHRSECADAGWRSRVLGEVRYGDSPGTAAWPLASIQAPWLAGETETLGEPGLGEHCLGELWLSPTPTESGTAEGIPYRRSEELLFGVVSETETPSGSGETAPLQRAAAGGYRRIFALMDRLGYPHLARAWNYFADINRDDLGLDRYRHFNAGRQDAFLTAARSLTSGVPAACALGVGGQPLTIAFLAARRPLAPIENPRQVSAYCYPPQYGPRSPTFSRATLARLGEQPILFVSGTASIAGHETWHPGDPAAQTRESLANLRAVLEAANRMLDGPVFTLTQPCLKVYLRHLEYLGPVRAVLARELGEPLKALFLQAEICRADLLVEIEATFGPPILSP